MGYFTRATWISTEGRTVRCNERANESVQSTRPLRALSPAVFIGRPHLGADRKLLTASASIACGATAWKATALTQLSSLSVPPRFGAAWAILDCRLRHRP